MNELVRAPPALPDAGAFPRNLGRDRLIHRSFRRRDAEPKPCRHLAPLAWRHERCPQFPVAQCLVDRRRSMARRHPDEARHSRAAHPQYRSSLCRGHNVPQSFHTGRAVRPGPGEPVDRPLPDEPSGRAEYNSARRALHQSWQGATRGRLRSRTGSAIRPPRPTRAPRGRTIRASSCSAASWTDSAPSASSNPTRKPISPGWRARGTSCLKRTGRGMPKASMPLPHAAIVPENQSKSASSAL